MLPFNPEFQTGESKITQVRLDILLQSGTLLNLTEEHVLLGGFTRDSCTTVDSKFTVGAAVTGKMTVALDNSRNNLSSYDFRGAEITASLGGQLSDETYQLVQVGIYTVDEYTYDGSNITLSGYDNLAKFDLPCSETSVTFPRTIKQLIDQACSVAGVVLANTDIPNGSFSIEKKPTQWDTMTWHDVIAYCAQIACCFVRILPNGKIFFSWYPAGIFNTAMLDGGSFDTTTTPYSDGDTADGGDFTYTDTEIFDGGTFGDRDNIHILGSLFDMSVDTDDVLITGVSVVLDPTNNVNATDTTTEYTKTLGTSDYSIRIENNPLIETTAATDSVCSYLYTYLVGMRFRPMSASVLENPSVEAGDVAMLVDRYNNTHRCFLSRVTYTTGAATSVSCDAESTLQNLRSRYTESEKTRALAQRTFEVAITNAEQAMQTILSATATTMGLYLYEESDGHGGTIYTFGNKATLAASNIRWRFSAGALMVSSDYGAHWNGALSSAGIAVLQEIYAVKVNADNIVAGTITGRAISGGTITGTSISGGTISGGAISGGTISGTSISGGLVEGSSVEGGTVMSYKPRDDDPYDGYATKIQNGKTWYFGGRMSYDELKEYTYGYAYGCITAGKTDSGVSLGLCILSPKQYVSIGKLDNSTTYTGYLYVNTGSGNIHGYAERVLISNASLALNSGSIKLYDGNIELYNDSTTASHTLRWRFSSDNTKYAYLGFYESTNTFQMINANNSAYANFYCGNLSSYGTKHRAVETEHYGTVGMNAFETAGSYFSDIGSGTIGEDGTVSIFFDPVFAETIEIKPEYQVFLTRTSETETTWVDKHQGYFTVHGDPGATFDWMVTAFQRDYATNRMERLDDIPKTVSDDPIVEENNSSEEAVWQMVDEYNSELEGLDDD